MGQMLIAGFVLLLTLGDRCLAIYTGATCPQPDQFVPVTATVKTFHCTPVTVNLSVLGNYSPQRLLSTLKNKCAVTCFWNKLCLWYEIHTDATCDQCLTPDGILKKDNQVTPGVAMRYIRAFSSSLSYFYNDRCVWNAWGWTAGVEFTVSPALVNTTKITQTDFCLATSNGRALIFLLYYDGVMVDGPIRQSEVDGCDSRTSFIVAEDDYITGVDIQKNNFQGYMYIYNMKLHTHLGVSWETNYSPNGQWTSTHGSNLRGFFGYTIYLVRAVGVIYDECTSP